MNGKSSQQDGRLRVPHTQMTNYCPRVVFLCDTRVCPGFIEGCPPSNVTLYYNERKKTQCFILFCLFAGTITLIAFHIEGVCVFECQMGVLINSICFIAVLRRPPPPALYARYVRDNWPRRRVTFATPCWPRVRYCSAKRTRCRQHHHHHYTQVILV